jgi:hypothetical protein
VRNAECGVRNARQNVPVDALGPVWQDGAAMDGSETQFSFTRAASSTSESAQNQIPISSMIRFKSESSPGLVCAPSYRKPPHSQVFNWACQIGLFLAGGCSTIDTSNTSDRPWDWPTKADVSKDWWFDLGGQYWDSPGGHFP